MANCQECGSVVVRHRYCDGDGKGLWGDCETCRGTGQVCSAKSDHDWSGKSDCFVATAAMGTDDDQSIEELRAFRDGWLARRATGRRFIRWYYAHGPALADVIRDHEGRRLVARVLVVRPAAAIARRKL